ncbi:hypothetical protein JYU34_000129 [Plutella xylostella]|uniref:Nuclear pore complex protein Nup153 n=1 Tax=Plutella xylostella TaxID=51655 RepID=A0ABQ7R6W2_PLUXY|nr:hypothetical protein JYU34_000129 [Plutella xylostella]
MSTVFTNNKGKRSRSSSNEGNNSFVKNVTSRMTGLLPATITKWFSSPSTTSNGSAQAADSDSSTEDEAADPGPAQPPPSKRMRFSPSANCTNFAETNAAESRTYDVTDHPEPCTSNSSVVQTPSTRTFRRDPEFVSTPLATTSEKSVDKSERDTTTYKTHTVSQLRRSVTRNRKSLFHNDSSASADASIKACEKTLQNTVQDLKQPYFKASLLGSPFYSGRTMYGGASSSKYLNQPNVTQRKVAVVNESNNADNTVSSAARRVMDLLEHYSSPLMEAKRIPPYTKKLNHSINNHSFTLPPNSTFENRIKSYKTQELYVPSVATFLRVKQRNRLMDSTSSARQIMASQSSTAHLYPASDTQDKEPSKYTAKVKSRLTRPKRGENSDFENDMLTPVELPTGTLQIDHNNLPKFSFGDATMPPASSTPHPSSRLANPLGSSKSNTAKTIISKNDNFKFSSPIRISHDQAEDDVDSKFTFGSPDRTVAKTAAAPLPPLSSLVAITNSKDWKCTDCLVPNKSDAVKCVCCGGQRPAPADRPPKCVVCKLANSAANKDKCVNCEKTQTNSLSKSTDSSKWKCDSCWVSNDEGVSKCVCCGATRPGAPAAAAAAAAPAAQWKCDDCWVSNKSELDKCACCGGAKPGAKKTTATPAPAASTGFKFGIQPAAGTPATPTAPTVPTGFKFGVQSNTDTNKTPISNSWNSTNSTPKITLNNSESSVKIADWRCDDCWVMNKGGYEQCAACGGAKPAATAPAPPTASFSTPSCPPPPAPRWECSSCLVKNDNNRMRCICCEAEKPGTKSEAFKNSFNFGATPNLSFKFGIDAAATKTDAVTTKPLEDVTKKLESETNNNTLPKAPTFSFATPDKKSVSLVTDKDKPTFSFGMPAKTESQTSSTNFLSAPVKVASVNNEEKEQEVPKMPELPKTNSVAATPDEGKQAPAPASTGSSGSLFKLPESDQGDKPKKPLFGSFLDSGAGKESTDSKSSPFMNKTETESKSIPSANAVTTTAAAAPATAAAVFTFNPVTTSEAPSFSFTAKTTPAIAPKFVNGDSDTFRASPFPAASSAAQKPPAFSFGSSTAFKPGEGAPMFGGSSSGAVTFGAATTAAPTFGSTAAPTFGAPATTAPTTFGAPATTAPPAFGAPATTAAPTFGAPATTAAPTFGAPSTAAPTFGAAASTPAPTFGSAVTNSAAPTFGSSVTNSAAPTFGSAVSNSAAPTFGSAATNSVPTFGSAVTNSAAPTFGSAATNSAVPTFGSAATNSAVPTFGSAVTNSPAPTFGSPAAAPALTFGGAASSTAPKFTANLNNSGSTFGGASFSFGGGMFSQQAAAPAPQFGAGSNMFAAPAAAPAANPAPAPAPAFNFGTPQAAGVFGFGQQQQPPQAGIYNFGAPAAGSPSVQFNMGSGAAQGSMVNTAGRKIRRATRRANQR